MLTSSRARTVVLASCIAIACTGRARAQSNVDVRNTRPAPDSYGFLAVEGTRTPGHLRWTGAFFVDWAAGYLQTTDAAGEEVEVVENRVSGDFMAQLGLGGRALVGAAASWVLFQNGEQLSANTPEMAPAAFYDPRLWAKYRLIGADADKETRHIDGPGLSVTAAVDLPVGRDEDYVGEGSTRTELEMNADFQLLGYGFGASLGWRARFDGRDLFGTSLHDELTFGAAAKLPIPGLHPIGALLEVQGATDFRSNQATRAEADLGLRWPVSKSITLTATVGSGFGSGLGAADVRIVSGVWWVPTLSDADGDGIDDDADGCPFLAEDRDGFQDEDGCEDPDNDNDLIPDVDDLCPNVEALEDRDDDEDGCTDR
jgi:OOP family OmpA-OmpF porin